MRSAAFLLAALACALASPPAHADPSRLGAESAVAEAGDCETELSLERRHARGEPPQRERSLRLACGVGWNSELEAAHARLNGHDGAAEAVTLEAKTRLREHGLGRVGWALALGLELQRRDGGWRRDAQALTVEATWPPGDAWLVEGKLGVVRDLAARRDSTRWALALEYALGARAELRAELEVDDRERPRLGLGLRYLLTEDLELKLSFVQRQGPIREQSIGLGLRFEF